MRITRDELKILQALAVSLRSTCGRKAVGAVIAIDGRTISEGYAGPPAGEPHCTESCRHGSTANGGCHRTIHAEVNAIVWAARKGRSTEGATLYCTDSPCKECAKLIVNSGIIRVMYLREYRDTTGIDYLNSRNIPCEIQTVPSAHFQNLLQLFASGGTGLPLPPE